MIHFFIEAAKGPYEAMDPSILLLFARSMIGGGSNSVSQRDLEFPRAFPVFWRWPLVLLWWVYKDSKSGAHTRDHRIDFGELGENRDNEELIHSSQSNMEPDKGPFTNYFPL